MPKIIENVKEQLLSEARRQIEERNEARMIPRPETQTTALAALTRWQGAVGMTGGRGSIEE